MSSARNPHVFPSVPPILSAGDGMRDYYIGQDALREKPHTLPNITPYLGLRARLSQVWLNRWTILLLLVLARTLIAVTGLHNDLATAEREAMSACTGVEDMGSALASMPHYLAAGVNDLAATGVEKAVNGLMSMLLLTITGVEEIVVFYINMLTSTYLCLITLAVSGSLHVAVQVAEDVTNFLNKTLGAIGADITKSVNGFESDLNAFIANLDSIPTFFGGHAMSIPNLNINGTLEQLNNIQLPATIDEGLNKLNASIPSFAQVNNFTNNAIRLPFEDVKTLINNSLGVYHFDRSVFPVPQREQLTFCSDNNGISDFFQDLSDIADLARKIFLAVIIVAAILVCVPMAYRDIMQWRTMQKRAQVVRDRAIDPLDIIYIASRPYTATAGIKAADKMGSTRRQILTRWVIAYATSPAALFIFSLAIAGLFSCLCQYILLRVIEKEVPALINEVDGFADKVIASLENSSNNWADGVNHAIVTTNNNINQDVFGWVNTTTGALNDTLNVFVDGVTDALNTTFGGTVLYGPITEVFNCLIGLKIAGIQKGLDWVSDHAHVDFPLFANDTFSLGAAASIAGNSSSSNGTDSFLANPGASTSDAISDTVTTVTTHLADAIRTEALIATTLLALWLLVVFLGLARALFLAAKRDKPRAEGGPSYAGDIELEPPRRAHSVAHQPPAYEDPHPASPAARFAGRGERPRDANPFDDENAWQDQKLGFAGERAPAGRVVPVRGMRGSEYGDIEDVKR
ncbi:plasma membrane fusion protein prm1 [Xylographa carneopallida]|nr:plasma membrane fusion protein prm1 [Xylographa carneopallida]